jgi:aminoglycoside phosphotransferase (APT) family kinase protein
LGVECHAARVDDVHGRYWLLLEKVPGVELWQVGSPSTWESVARWLARFHRAFAEVGFDLTGRNPYLIRYDGDLFGTWPPRALEVAAVRGVGAEQRRSLERIAAGYDEVVAVLCAIPPTFVHGELYPSNVLVDEGPPSVRVWPVDWEMAGVGPAYLDVVALTTGWDGAAQARLAAAYVDELGPAPWRYKGDELARLLDCCRLHYAWQWLGWSADWSPPPEHARDWVGEVLEVGQRLGL